MAQLGKLVLVFSTLVFLASSMSLALHEDQQRQPSYIVENIPVEPNLLAAVLLIPEDMATWVILVGVWITVAGFAIFTMKDLDGERALPPADIALLSGAFLCGAVWPWIAYHAPLAGFLVCVIMLIAQIAAISRRMSDGRLAHSPLIGIILGWTTILTFTAFASFIHDAMRMPPELASLVASVIACVTTMAVQMRMPRNALYTITVMFAFLALSAAMIESAPAIAVISVLSIAALTFLLVRVTT
ncbi:hypothetical protein [Paracoccus aerodenitrificans]|uniref:hypothetical protein n=1 Tax=Paracoccus aerodenitrificans TaxID=3017781 RepID=UPI0022F01C96|nr:hypothetical protein [Paracoccus aerodenitrificans]WBU63249.1 hypothetical protein PAE61_12895 [Paracoccus aerodenitrificans]